MAEIVKRPEEYKWSSYGMNAWGDHGWLAPHDEYLALGKSIEERCYVYRDIFKTHLNEENLNLFRKSAHDCQPIGDEWFKRQIEKKWFEARAD